MANLLDSVVQVFYSFTDFLSTGPITETAMWKFPTIIENFSISPCNYISGCLIYFEDLLKDAWAIKIVISSWSNNSFVIKKWLSLSLVIVFALKSTLPVLIEVLQLSFHYWYVGICFFHSFTSNLIVLYIWNAFPLHSI